MKYLLLITVVLLSGCGDDPKPQAAAEPERTFEQDLKSEGLHIYFEAIPGKDREVGELMCDARKDGLSERQVVGLYQDKFFAYEGEGKLFHDFAVKHICPEVADAN